MSETYPKRRVHRYAGEKPTDLPDFIKNHRDFFFYRDFSYIKGGYDDKGTLVQKDDFIVWTECGRLFHYKKDNPPPE